MQGSLFDLPDALPRAATATPPARRAAVAAPAPLPMLDLASAGGDVRPDDEEGTWTGPAGSLADHVAALDAAHANLATADPRVRPFYAVGIAARRAVLARMLERDPDATRVCSVWGHHERLSLASGRALTALCEPGVVPGAQVRRRASRDCREALLFIDGLGTLELRSSLCDGGEERSNSGREDDPYVLDYEPGRTAAVAESYRDVRRTVEAPISVWGHVAASQLCSSTERPSVSTYLYAGRRYVTTGACYSGSYAEGYAWLLEAQDDWIGPVYTRQELLRLWDRGARERGDDRGLVVTARGATFVLGQPVLFVDHNAVVQRPADRAEPDEDDHPEGEEEEGDPDGEEYGTDAEAA
jgi:hypothetical protein